MKKEIVIIRFGVHQPLRKEVTIIEELTDGRLEGSVCGSFADMGVLSIINTEHTIDDIVKVFRRVAEETGDTLPVIAFELGSTAVSHHFEDMLEFKALVKQFKDLNPTVKRGCTLSLDELLDLVNEKGLPNLNTEELMRLKELTKQ
jgi:hypothetical protein